MGLADGVLLVLQESEHVVHDSRVVDGLIRPDLCVHHSATKILLVDVKVVAQWTEWWFEH